MQLIKLRYSLSVYKLTLAKQLTKVVLRVLYFYFLPSATNPSDVTAKSVFTYFDSF